MLMPPMAKQILLHPGFHKTGTSTAQHVFWLNRDLLAPHVAIFQLRHLREVAKLCMGYAKTQNPLLLMDMIEALDSVFADVTAADPRHILISCEGLSGHLPGWPDVDTYAAAPVTISYICGYLEDRFPDHRLAVTLTTRGADEWLYSAYRHHLRGYRLGQSWDEFHGTYRAAADLDAIVRDIREGVAPVPVTALPLEASRDHPLGPGGAILNGLDLPSGLMARLDPVDAGNQGPSDDLADKFLALNRGDLPDGEVQAQKDALAEMSGVGGWKKVSRA